ncbi:pyridoxamine 5'-phosphate oxidase family protein [Amycolatopsis sp. H6(2020)]|nr:pyridoxamine 5'-phosphate oxidase family protein [Amycolatopsis sp. H6(2020)]
MTARLPTAERMTGEGTVLDWAAVRDGLTQAKSFWLATVRPDGLPHLRPLLCAWLDDALHVCSNPSARKAKNVDGGSAAAIGTSCPRFDVVVEGPAERVTDVAALRRIADAFRDKYGWPVVERDGALDAEYAAPTAGAPPFAAYTVTPVTAFVFPTTEGLAPTRWRFG